MTEREQISMTAIKRMLDAYHELPLSVRAAIDGKLDAEIGGLQLALKMYKGEVRTTVHRTVVESGIHGHRSQFV